MLIKIIKIILFIAWLVVNVCLGSISAEVKEATIDDRKFYQKKMRKYVIITCIAYFILGGISICSML